MRGTEGLAHTFDDHVRAVAQQVGADPHNAPAEGFESRRSVDVPRALTGVGPMLGSVILDDYVPLGPAEVSSGHHEPELVTNQHLCCGRWQSSIDQQQPGDGFRWRFGAGVDARQNYTQLTQPAHAPVARGKPTDVARIQTGRVAQGVDGDDCGTRRQPTAQIECRAGGCRRSPVRVYLVVQQAIRPNQKPRRRTLETWAHDLGRRVIVDPLRAVYRGRRQPRKNSLRATEN